MRKRQQAFNLPMDYARNGSRPFPTVGLGLDPQPLTLIQLGVFYVIATLPSDETPYASSRNDRKYNLWDESQRLGSSPSPTVGNGLEPFRA